MPYRTREIIVLNTYTLVRFFFSCKLHVEAYNQVGGERIAKTIGKVHHYYDKIGVAALILSAPLKIGDAVKITGHGKDVTQIINSMQIEHKQVQKAKKSDDVAIKIDEVVREGDEVTKL